MKTAKRVLAILLSVLMIFSTMTVIAGAETEKNEEVQRDIVLMLDISDSMEGTAFYTMKEAAVKFCEQLMSASGSNRIALVVWDYSYYTHDFTYDIDEVKENIQRISLGGGTNTAQALSVAKNMMDSGARADAVKNIVLLTDGIPQHGTFTETGKYTSEDYPSYYGYANTAYNVASTITEKYNLYTLGFFHNLYGDRLAFAQRFLKDIQNAGYYEVTDPDDLEFTFGEIAGDIGDNTCPIVIIPGIMGSNLYSDKEGKECVWAPSAGSVIWNSLVPFKSISDKIAYGKTLYTINNYDNQVELSARADDSTWTSGTREYGAQNTYKNLVDGLCARFPNREIYFFSYDFRQSNVDSAQDLADYVEEMGFEKFDIVAHSMGGIVSSHYMKSEENRSHVRKLITCGTPYEGAPKLLNSVLNWDVLTNRYEQEGWNGFVSMMSDNFLGLAGLTKEVKAGFPSTAELAPTKNYFGVYEWYQYSHTEYGSLFNPKITHYYDLIDYYTYKNICTNVFGSKFSTAVANQESLNVNGYNLLTTLNNTYFVVGINQMTIGSIMFSDGDTLKSIECDDLMYEYQGDGTVPYYSATIMKKLESLGKGTSRVLKVDADHSGVVQVSKSLSWIYDVLGSGNSEIKDDEAHNKSYIVVRIACPVEVQITKNGETLSSHPDDLSTKTNFGRIDFLGGSDEIKMLCLEDTEDLDILLECVGDGTMDYEIRYYSAQGQLKKSETFNEVPVSEGMLIKTSTGKLSNQLNVDSNADGLIDQILKSETTQNIFEWLISAIKEFFGKIGAFFANLFTPHDDTAYYTITYLDTDGKVLGKASYPAGSSIAAPPIPEKSGYVFMNWYPAIPEVMPEKDITVTAQWAELV